MTSQPPPTGGGARPFAIGGPATASWREQALGRAAEYRFLARWLLSQNTAKDRDALLAIEQHIEAAERAAAGLPPDAGHGPANGRRLGFWARVVSFLGGASVERVNSQLDAAETDLLRLAPDPYLRGALPSLLAHVRAHLPQGDPRREQVEAIAHGAAARPEEPLSELERDQALSAVRAASLESRREIRRVRNFRNLLLVSALILTLCVAGVTVLGVSSPDTMPMCFAPDDAAVVCPTKAEAIDPTAVGPDRSSESVQAAATADQVKVDEKIRATATSWDIPIVEIVGLLAAALASAFAMRSIQGTSTPYSLPVALAVLKLPSGALTAVLGLLLMRGGFVPGLSALDSSAQIIAWAIVFGYSQQLITRLVDQQANTVLENVGKPATPPLETASLPRMPAQPAQPPSPRPDRPRSRAQARPPAPQSQRVANASETWMSICRRAASPVLVKPCGSPAGMITTSPGPTSRDSSPAVNVAVPSSTIMTSA